MKVRGMLGLLLAALLVGGPAQGAAPLVVDPAGDALAGRPELDITSIDVTTSGQKVKGRYVPVQLHVVWTLAGPPSAGPGVVYEFRAALNGPCEFISWVYTPGTVKRRTSKFPDSEVFTGCPEGYVDPAEQLPRGFRYESTVKDNTITFTLPVLFLTLLAPGSPLSQIRGYADLADPVTGRALTGVDDSSHGDFAKTDATYRIR